MELTHAQLCQIYDLTEIVFSFSLYDNKKMIKLRTFPLPLTHFLFITKSNEELERTVFSLIKFFPFPLNSH